MKSLLPKKKNIKQAFFIFLCSVGLSGFSQSAQTTYTFTTAGATGPLGPDQSMVNAAYANSTLDGMVTVGTGTSAGIQFWVVPASGNYQITALGAQGYGPNGGRGVSMSGEFFLNAGDTLKILVGQEGGCCIGSGTNQHGGGGGSFVTYPNNTPLMIAGGGGGSWASSFTANSDASISTSGNPGMNGTNNGTGGTNGNGGTQGNSADGGGGFFTNGTGTAGGTAYVNGGTGGTGAANGADGGFGGGGGGSSWNNRRGGGGGGYSGGGGSEGGTTGFPEGGGGGSYNAGTNQVNTAGVQLGDGEVIVELLSPPAPYNPGVAGLYSTERGYFMRPISQAYTPFNARVINYGDTTITGTTLGLSVLGTGFSSSTNIGTMVAAQDTTVILPQPFFPTFADTFTAQCVVSINELDTLNFNDTATYEFLVSDTTLARDDGIVENGIGGETSSVSFGHRFRVFQTDTITSVSFYLDDPTAGSKIKFYLMSFNTTTMEPDILIDSTRVLQVPQNGSGWYTMKMGCGELVLPNGYYFIAAEQLNPVNMSFGYSLHYPNVNEVINYVDLHDGQGWLPSNDPALNQLLNSITFMLRVNFGHERNQNILGGDTTRYCNGSKAVLGKNFDYNLHSWSTGTFNDSLVTDVDGPYSVTVTDELGCTYTGSTYVKENDQISTFPSSTPTSTCGGNDGQAQIVATGQFPPYSYSWSSGQSGLFANNLSGGTYQATVTDNLGCSRVTEVNVLGAYPTATYSTTSPSCNGYANGAVTANIQTGFGPYSYSWSGGQNGQTANGLPAGTYSVSVTDASGCTTVDQVNLANPPIINIDSSGTEHPTQCRDNDGMLVANVSGGVPPYQYAWSTGQTTNISVGAKAGTYTVTVTDDVGCAETETITISDPNAPSLSTNGSSVTCGSDQTGTVSVNVTGGASPYAYLWSTNHSTSSVSNLSSGTYYVEITDANNCIVKGQATVSGPAAINATLQANYDANNSCNNEIILSSLSGGTPPFTYQWDDSLSQTTPSAVGLCNGGYSLTVTDNNGCTKSFSLILHNPSTGIDGITGAENIKVFPVPASDRLNIQMAGKEFDQGQLEIINMLGETVYSVNKLTTPGTVEVEVGTLAPGQYLIKVKAGENAYIQKFQVSE